MPTARRFEELEVWKLAGELRDRIVRGTQAADWRDRATRGCRRLTAGLAALSGLLRRQAADEVEQVTQNLEPHLAR